MTNATASNTSRELHELHLSPAPGSWGKSRPAKPSLSSAALCLAHDFSREHHDALQQNASAIELSSRYSMSQFVRFVWKPQFLVELRKQSISMLYFSVRDPMYLAEVETGLICDPDDEVVVEIRVKVKRRSTQDAS